MRSAAGSFLRWVTLLVLFAAVARYPNDVAQRLQGWYPVSTPFHDIPGPPDRLQERPFLEVEWSAPAVPVSQRHGDRRHAALTALFPATSPFLIWTMASPSQSDLLDWVIVLLDWVMQFLAAFRMAMS